jgi:hypothetical protein
MKPRIFENLSQRSNVPILGNTPYLRSVYGAPNLGDPRLIHHNAIDLHAPPKTQFYAPEVSKFIKWQVDSERTLVDILLYGLNSQSIYLFAHCDPKSIFERRYSPGQEIDENFELGRIGQWRHTSFHYPEVRRQFETVNSDGSHLHLAVYSGLQDFENTVKLFDLLAVDSNARNPEEIINFQGGIISL